MSVLAATWSWIGDNASIIVATLAFIATGLQAYFARQHNRVSVRPHFSTVVAHERTPDGLQFLAVLQNNGLGPAFVKSFEILVDDVPHQITELTEVAELFRARMNMSIPNGRFFVLRKGAVVKAGAEYPLANVAVPVAEGITAESIASALQSFQLRLVYASAYGEEFTYDSRKHREV